MRTQGYIDTFYATMTPNAGQFVPLTILIGIWNAPLVAVVLLCKALYRWQKQADQRSHLETLEAVYLHDMGISREDALSGRAVRRTK